MGEMITLCTHCMYEVSKEQCLQNDIMPPVINEEVCHQLLMRRYATSY